jgi:hypothetical protein
MPACQHLWKMANIQYGFTVFERCSHCQNVRTYFSQWATWDEYREGACTWSIVENAQTFRFDLQCSRCGCIEGFEDLLGLLYCPGCLNDCEVDVLRKKYEAEKTWILVAFGFLPEAKTNPVPQHKLDMLTDYFNQRRDTSRSKVKILSCHLIKDFSLCKGELLHDVGMLSLEPPEERKQLF